MSDLPTQIAETVQTVHIQHDPDPNHDLNPSTAASKREPVAADSIDTEYGSDDDNEDDGHVPLSVLRPPPEVQPRSTQLYPVPDLRFEQSYLHSIASAETAWKVAWITLVHQVRKS